MTNENNIQPQSPYKGLAPYDISDKDNFFGRAREKQILLGKIFAHNVTLLFAGTGAGKSSLLRAAIIPALTEQYHLDVAYYADWVSAPLEGLKTTIQQTLIANGKITGRELKLGDDLPDFLATCTAYASEPLILMLDQFEEIFQYHARSGRLLPFVEQLARVVNTPDLPVSVVLAMREDFLAEMNVFKGHIPRLFDNYYRLEQLRIEQAREAIEKPIAQVGFRYEDGLVDQLLADLAAREQEHQHTPLSRITDDAVRPEPVERGTPSVHGSTDSPRTDREIGRVVEPPYLQIVCNELWRAEQGNPKKVITTSRYIALGRTTQIVRKHFEQAMAHFSLREQSLAFEMFRYLVTERGTKMAYRAEDLASDQLLGAPVNELQPILAYLASKEARILRADQRLDQTWYELYHDVFAQIIRAWTEEFQADDDRRIYRQLGNAARKWANAGRDDTLLLRGAALLETKDWHKRNRAESLAPDEQAFLRLSLTKYARGLWLRRGIVAVITVFAVISAIAGWYARTQQHAAILEKNRAEQEQKIAKKKTKEAVTALAKAEEATKEADRRAGISLAQTLNYQALDQLTRKEVTRAALLARQAYLFHQQYQGTMLAQMDSALRQTLPLSAVPGAVLNHNSEVYTVAFSPDGKFLASGSKDGAVRLWDSSTVLNPGLTQLDVALRVLYGHSGAVNSVVFSPDGKRLASASEDKTLRVWNLMQPDAEPIILTGHESAVISVTFGPDGKRLASGSEDKTVRVWDVTQPVAAPRVLAGHEETVFSVAFNPDGTRLASASHDKTVRVWDLKKPTAVPLVLAGHKDKVWSVAFSPDSTHLASGSSDKTVCVWNLAQPDAAPRVLAGHEGVVSSVTFSSDGMSLASGSADQTVRLWDLAQPDAPSRIVAKHKNTVWSVTFSLDGTRLVTGSADTTMRVWDLMQPTAVPHILAGHEDSVQSVAFSLDGLRLASGSSDKTVRMWDLTQPAAAPRVLAGHTNVVSSVVFSPDGTHFASGSADNTVRMWNIVQPDTAPLILTADLAWAFSVAFSPDGTRLAAGNRDKTIWVWNLTQPDAPPRLLTGHEESVYSVAFSPDGMRLASGGLDGTVRIWGLTPLLSAAPRVLTGHTGVSSVVFSPDGKHLASGGGDKIVRVWDMTQPTSASRILAGHDNSVNSVAFSPDGTRLASGSADNTVRMWDLTQPTATPIILTGHKRAVNSVAFSPDGTRLASGSDDKTVRVWNIQTEELAALICKQAERNLTWEEWQQFVSPDIPYESTCSNLPAHPSLIEAAATSGKIAEAQSLLQAAKQFESVSPIPWRTLQTLCRYGSLWGHAADVMDACEQAVPLADSDGYGIRDSRGLARALTGNITGAIEDFQKCMGDKEKKAQCRQWIEALKKGENPFTPEVLEGLRNE